MPRGIGSSGIGACTMVSHLAHEHAGRTWRFTSKCPGMYASTSVALSLTVRSSVPPQVLHTPGGMCTTSRRGSSGGNWRRFFFSGCAAAASCASGSGSCDADASASAFAASASSRASSS